MEEEEKKEKEAKIREKINKNLEKLDVPVEEVLNNLDEDPGSA